MFDYIGILTWALRRQETDYIEMYPAWFKIELNQTGWTPQLRAKFDAFLTFFSEFRKHVVPIIQRIAPNQHWANQYVFSDIDDIVQRWLSDRHMKQFNYNYITSVRIPVLLRSNPKTIEQIIGILHDIRPVENS
jgi:hypothetical protein